LAIAVQASACTSTPTFVCTTNTQCTSETNDQGICEPTGSCSFADSSCPGTGRRYPDGAGDLSSTCVPAPSRSCLASLNVGTDHSCALRTDGKVYCWGSNATGQLGDGTTTDHSSPTAVVGLPATAKATAVSTGEGWTCALLDDQTIWCWGDNSTAELGQCDDGSNSGGSGGGGGAGGMGAGAAKFSATPLQVMTHSIDNDNKISCKKEPFKAKSVSIGGKHACALGVDGGVACWGENSRAQCGKLTSVVDDAPGPLPVDLDGTTAIGAGDDYSCARKDDKSVRCWGSNAKGSLGDGKGGMNSSDNPIPVGVAEITSAGDKPSDLVLADETACVRYTDGSLYCWGDASSGIFGPSSDAVLVPKRLLSAAEAFSGATAKHICVTDVAKNMKCWGANLKGQTGTGTLDPNLYAPTPALLISVEEAALGAEHTCAITTGGELWCWGENGHGQLGLGMASDTPQTVPRRVAFPCE
jgi:hypothetical protein